MESKDGIKIFLSALSIEFVQLKILFKKNYEFIRQLFILYV